MALSRFLRPKSSLPVYRIGVSRVRARRFSSTCGENEKTTQLMREEKRIVAVERAPKEYEMKWGGPWCSLRKVFDNLKDSMLRRNQSQNGPNNDASTPLVDPSASVVIESHNVPDHIYAELQDSELELQCQRAEEFFEDKVGDSGASNVAGHSSAEMVEGTYSEVNDIPKSLPFPKPEDADALNKKSVSIVVASCSSEENCSNEALDLNYAEVNERGKVSDEVSSSSFWDLDTLLISNLENLSSFKPSGLVEESTIAEGIVASGPRLTGSGKVEQPEPREIVKAMHGTSKKAMRLTDLFRKKSYDETEYLAGNQGTKPSESLSDALLNIPEEINFQSEHLLQSRATSDWQDGHITELTPNKCENNPSECKRLSSEGVEVSSSSNPTQKLLDFKKISTKSAYNQEAEEFPARKSCVLTFEHYEHSKETLKEDEEKAADIKSLIDFIRQQEDVPSSTTSDCANGGLIQDNLLSTNLQRCDNNKFTSGKYPTTNSSVEDEETSSLDSEPTDRPDLKFLVSRKSKDQNKFESTLEAAEGSEENKVLVRFLRKNVFEDQITLGLAACGEILKVNIHDVGGPLFKVASVHFKTRKAVRRALKHSQIVSNGVVVVESATSKEKIEKIPIPSLIGDPDLPTALVKNPTRTVKIGNLTHVISSRHIEEVLALSEINISGYFLGSSSSVAYVEFETEMDKEKALEKHSINVLGRNLVMLRIDAPRTTVVRISNIESLPLKIVNTLCKSVGDLRTSVLRCPNIVDAGFALTEWPNILNILNRLNGTVVEGRRLQAKPAPVFPPDVLLALWDQLEERKYLKATMQDLLHKLGSPSTGTSEVAHMLNNFVDRF